MTTESLKTGRSGVLASLIRWADSWAPDDRDDVRSAREIDWVRVFPFVALHLSCLLVLYVGWSWTAVVCAVAYYFIRMFAITAFYHRYFSHRSFETSRTMQFLFAVLGSTAIQRGPIWWASHHREHHRHSDQEGDVHSPDRDGFLWSHIGWILSQGNYKPRFELVRDLARFPELRFIDRFDVAIPLLTIPALYGVGAALQAAGFATSGLQILVWCFCVSTVVTYHITFSINSFAHRIGSRPYETKDQSRNNFFLALLTLGEGWHNNHHRYQASARQGFRWWEIDVSYYLVKLMSLVGLVWNVRPMPARILAERNNR